ncbi:hypothetical protein D0T50_05025 [Bacteroides sp. 214]|uniref:DUF5703 domain-containing protein n=1 Tax=Bacteroides sp. 214 TaxID=2302935 RepID=UPI0013D7A68A|nr:DUF5703 domain-containing protein [Bacteroides sp. 214]NDW12251.1 hypothetical protein [Bacteroides sp. 214]
MRKRIYLLFIATITVLTLYAQPTPFVWNSPSQNSSESMPCGGGDIGMNVWVENGDILFYINRSGTFDEHNTLLKLGRVRLRLSPNPFENAKDFCQTLNLNDGFVEISAGGTNIHLWASIHTPVIHLEVNSRRPVTAELFYENWRYQDRPIRKGEGQQNSYKWAPPKGSYTAKDSIVAIGNELVFYHRNPKQTVFDAVVAQQGMDVVKDSMMNPLAHLTFGGKLRGNNLVYSGTQERTYAGTDYRAWRFRTSQPVRREYIRIALHTEQTESIEQWQHNLHQTATAIHLGNEKKEARAWWNNFWKRSHITAIGAAEEITRNYTLFRYMLGCNAYGTAPTKFNGGLFTFDPCYVDSTQNFTPDYRKWGGGTMTAQNQRLVYWPMLKSGDADMMTTQFDFYNRILGNAELRSRVYWGHNGACFTEQIENFGLPNPAEYGFKRPDWFDKGLEYNAWLEYEWDTVLEFCQMILETANYQNVDISQYIPLIESSLTFFEEHYRYLAKQRGRKDLDDNGHLVLYPGSACETYKMANNASSTIAALRVVLETYGKKNDMLSLIPPIPYRVVDGKEMISPAKTWERVNNVETPQLYPVFPWRIYGVGREGLEIARNTYFYDPDAIKFRSHMGWKQDNIWAACLGLTEEAVRLALLKLGDGPYRFPAFWGPGYDWSPDHNHGGSGMIGLQEMLLQTNGTQIYLFPAWPSAWDVQFKLHAPGNTTVEATLKNGKLVKLTVNPESRTKDIVIINNNIIR